MAKLPPVEKGIEIPPHLLDNRYAWGLQRLEVYDSIFVPGVTKKQAIQKVANFRQASGLMLWDALYDETVETPEDGRKAVAGVRLWRIQDRPTPALRAKKPIEIPSDGGPMKASEVRHLLNQQQGG